MKNRAYSIDVLRGLAIIGMVLSGQILWHADLPAWLFHAQVPPPDFKFNPAVAGITWVDLVFPFFLFSMGAAFPLALRKKIEKGISQTTIFLSILRRGFFLALFAIALANTRIWGVETLAPIPKSLLMLATWALFFCMFYRIPNAGTRKNNMLNFGGALGVAALMLIYKFVLNLNISIEKSDIIILILANMAVFGTFAWWFTRNSIAARFAIIAIVVAMKISANVDGSWNQALWNFSPMPWLYKMEFLKYLCIILLGSIAGDRIYAWMKDETKENDAPQRSVYSATVITFIVFCVNMWALFTRNLVINVVATILLGVLTYMLFKRGKTKTEKLLFDIFRFGFFMLILGLVFEAFEGGIKKDYATISYFFVTSGLAAFVVIISTVLINYCGCKFGALVKCGQNPMIAYTASGFFVMPVLAIIQIAPMLEKMAAAQPWLGVLRGVIVTILMMLVTIFFTNKKIFWRT